MQQAQLGDAGVQFVITLVNASNTAIDVSGAMSVNLLLARPNNGGLKTFTMSFVTNGKDGQVQYTTAQGDLDTLGVWQFQVKANFSNGPMHSVIDRVMVKANLG